MYSGYLSQDYNFAGAATVVSQKSFAGQVFAEHGPFLQATYTYVVSHHYIYSQVYFSRKEVNCENHES